MINKKSQIGSTLTWIVGFLIIFFIMTLFITGTLVLTGRKKINYGDDEIKLEDYRSRWKSQTVLLGFLKKTYNNHSIKQYILNESFKEEILRNNLKDYLSKLHLEKEKNYIYFFHIYSENKSFPEYKIENLHSYNDNLKNNFLKNSVVLFINSDKKTKKIKFYMGEFF